MTSPANLIVSLIEEQSALNVALDELKTKHSKVESELRIKQAANEILETQVSMSFALATQYRGKNNSLFETNSTLRDENLTSAYLLTTKQDENTKLRQENAKLLQENATLQAQLAVQISTNSDSHESQAKLHRENADLRRKICLLEANEVIQSGIIAELKKREEHFETSHLGKPFDCSFDCSFDEPHVMESVPLPGCMQAFY